jgi:hypothetical protein
MEANGLFCRSAIDGLIASLYSKERTTTNVVVIFWRYQMVSLPIIRQEGGFKRTTCGCELCSCYCKVMPGFLVPSDLERLIPKDADPMAWARTHLRASKGSVMVNTLTGETISSIPSLVPAKQANGHCHWLNQDGKCNVHSDSPFGCAFYDQHMKDEEAERRNHYARMTRAQAFDEHSLYAEIWHMLKTEGLVGGGEYAQSQRELQRVRSTMERRQTFAARRDRRKAKKRQRQQRRSGK